MDKKEIILAQICNVYSEGFVAKKNGHLKNILRCCGLGEEYISNSEYLEPYWYKGTWENDNKEYNIFVGLDNIFSKLISDGRDDDIISLLKELGERIPQYVFDEDNKPLFKDNFEKLCNLYQLIGLDIKTSIEETIYNSACKIQVTAFVKEENRLGNSYCMEEWLEDKYPNVYDSYESALNSYSNGDLGASIESCRTTLTGLFSKFKGLPFQNGKWLLGLATVTGDFRGTVADDVSQMCTIKNSIENMNKKDISDFFGDNLCGSYKKTKAIYSIYSMLSDYGTHREEGTVEVPTAEDALMMIRMTTDILIWVYQKHGQ